MTSALSLQGPAKVSYMAVISAVSPAARGRDLPFATEQNLAGEAVRSRQQRFD
jgi:hypothetical protein